MGLLGVIIGVLGLVLSLLLFWIQKIKKYPSQLSYSILDCSRIVGKRDTEFQDVSLHYRDYDVKDDLFYVRILIFNKRSSDVKADGSDSPISLLLTDSSKWLDIRINNESEDVGSAVTINQETPQIASLTFPLLKKREHIVLDGLIESSSFLVEKEESFLKINHRIAELDSFVFVPVVTERRYKGCKRTIRTFGFAIGVMILYLVFWLFSPETSPIRYRSNNVSDPVEYCVAIDKMNRIVVDKYKAISFGIRNDSVMSKEEFESNYYPEYLFHRTIQRYNAIVLYVIIIFLFGVLMFDELMDVYRFKMLRKYNDK